MFEKFNAVPGCASGEDVQTMIERAGIEGCGLVLDQGAFTWAMATSFYHWGRRSGVMTGRIKGPWYRGQREESLWMDESWLGKGSVAIRT